MATPTFRLSIAVGIAIAIPAGVGALGCSSGGAETGQRGGAGGSARATGSGGGATRGGAGSDGQMNTGGAGGYEGAAGVDGAGGVAAVAGSGGSGGSFGGGGGGSVLGGGGAAASAGSFHVPFDWNGIIGNGQSLSVGSRGTPIIGTKQPFNNLKLNDATGKYALDSTGTLTLVPLVEPIRPLCATGSSPYPCNIYGETPHNALSIELTTMAKAAGAADYVTLHSVVGQGAQPMSVIDKGGSGNAYDAGLSEARSFERMAAAASKSFGYVAVVFTHGEADNNIASTYEAALYKLAQDYDADLKTITGQTQSVPLIASQQMSSPPTGNAMSNTPLGGTALAVWKAGVDHPGQVICAGPKYQYRYYSSDGATTDPHLYAAGYRRLGEKYAEIIDTVMNRGIAWSPLQPTSASLSGASLTIAFHVPSPPLAWEPSLAFSTTVAAWKNGRGFEVVDSTGPIAITNAAISANNVILTLASAPTGSGLRVRYVTHNGCAGNCGNHMVGELRDADPLVGADAQTISCAVTQGSADIVCSGAAPLATREWHDLVTGSGLADDTVIVTTDKSTKATLSGAWIGPSGTASLRFAYDQRNYAVQFDLAVP
jgi:hypothetical protein